MYTETKLTLALCAINLLLVASSQAGVVHDERGNAVEPASPVDAADLAPNGKGWGEHSRETSNSTTSTNPFLKMAPDGKGSGEPIDPSKARSNGSVTKYPNGISYHGGPLILGTTNVYYIWYGNWSGNSATAILPAFAVSISGSPYYNINTTYHDASNRTVSNAVAYYTNALQDSYSQGPVLSDAGVKTIVSNAISSGALPKDTNGVYFVLTSADVNETSGFCTQYCGWHTHGTIAGSDIKYSFVGNPDRCPSACSAQSVGPNGNAGADGMASIIAHELEEAVTDPDLNAWYDTRGRENADKCAWTFGTTYSVANGAKANMKLGLNDYLIQQNWVNASGGYCAVKYP